MIKFDHVADFDPKIIEKLENIQKNKYKDWKMKENHNKSDLSSV